MSYETMPIESKRAATVHVLTGTVSDLDEEAGTVEVDIDGHGFFPDVPVFYHCQNEETADGMPFSEADRVLVVNSGDATTLSVSDMKVVGFADGLPRKCPPVFILKLTTNDGILITEASGLLIHIKLYAASDPDNPVATSTPVYDSTTERWRIGLTDLSSLDPDGYWIDCKSGCSFNTQYPGYATLSQRRKIEDLVQPSTYDVTLLSSCFRIMATRADGIIVDAVGEASPLSAQVKDSSQSILPRTLSYDAITQRWTLEINSEYIDINGYWILMSCDDGVLTQYPSRWRSINFYQSADLIHPGQYDAVVHFFIKEYWSSVCPYTESTDCFDLSWLSEGAAKKVSGSYMRRYLSDGGSFTHHIEVKSSVDYLVTAYSYTASMGDVFAVTNYLVWDGVACASAGGACTNSAVAEGTWSDVDVAEVSFAGNGLSCKLTREGIEGDDSSSQNYGPSIGGSTHSVTASNTTPSSHSGTEKSGGPGHYCPSSGPLAYTWFNDYFGVDAFINY